MACLLFSCYLGNTKVIAVKMRKMTLKERNDLLQTLVKRVAQSAIYLNLRKGPQVPVLRGENGILLPPPNQNLHRLVPAEASHLYLYQVRMPQRVLKEARRNTIIPHPQNEADNRLLRCKVVTVEGVVQKAHIISQDPSAEDSHHRTGNELALHPLVAHKDLSHHQESTVVVRHHCLGSRRHLGVGVHQEGIHLVQETEVAIEDNLTEC